MLRTRPAHSAAAGAFDENRRFSMKNAEMFLAPSLRSLNPSLVAALPRVDYLSGLGIRDKFSSTVVLPFPRPYEQSIVKKRDAVSR